METKYLNILEYPKIIDRLAENTHFSLSREKALALLPQTEEIAVKEALLDTDFALTLSLRTGEPSFRGASDISDAIRRAELGSMLNAGELLNVAGLIRSARFLKKYIADYEGPQNRITTLFENIAVLKELEDTILSKILSEEEIADTASAELLSIRRKMKDAHAKIKEHLNRLIHSSSTQKYLQDPIVTMRQDRYVIPVKAEYKAEVKGIVHDTSASGATLFVEPMPIVELNNELRTLAVRERAEIDRILMELSISVAAWVEDIRLDLSIVVELDFVFAKAKLALQMDANLPELNAERVIDLKRARHPLIEKHVAVPIDVNLGRDFHTLVVTGPNTGGKTVTLKTIGLLQLMAQAGLFIPAAAGSSVGVFEQIFADIGDEQSIEQSLSTFSSHMTNIVHILEIVHDSSLVLFDELGAGTDPVEGAALAIAILEDAAAKGARIAATTHYSELKMYAIKTHGVENASCEFDVETLKPTYRLLIGVPGKSNAFAIAQKLGLPGDVIERSRSLLTQENVRFEDVISSIEKSKKEAEQRREEALRYQREAEALKEDLKRQRQSQEEKGRQILNAANEEALNIVEAARKKSDEYLRELNAIMFQKKDKESLKALEKQRLRIREEAAKQEKHVREARKQGRGYFVKPEQLLPGTTVLLYDINQEATVVSPPDSSGNLMVQAGIIKIKTKLSNIRSVSKGETKDPAQSYVKNRGEVRLTHAKSELDIRGMNVEEAILETEKFLDEALLANLEQVTIIHGKGTGVLRAGIQKYLRGCGHVKSFRLGNFGEGESGVTIVELK